MDIQGVCAGLRSAARLLATHTAERKNRALGCAAAALKEACSEILKANAEDVALAHESGMADSLIDRLTLNEARFAAMVENLMQVASQPDPVGECLAGWTTENGLRIRQLRVPLGVAALIYESRPNVTVDAFALAYKSGNAVLLRGSSSALHSNRAIAAAIQAGLAAAGSDGVEGALYLADSGSRDEVELILTARGLIDVVLPRGSAELIRHVVSHAQIPVIKTGSGVCHLFIDAFADYEEAARIAENGKLQRPGVCNALETLVVHREAVASFLPLLENICGGRCEFRCDADSYAVLRPIMEAHLCLDRLKPASDADYGFEFLAPILAVKTVSSIDEAIEFINGHTTGHSEVICTGNLKHAGRFQQEVDAACVYVNASSRFSDGGCFGFGTELGISTQKLHARGPMGMSALTTTKYLIEGDGQIR